MKVLHISNYRSFGGGTMVARALAERRPQGSILLFLEPGGSPTGPIGSPPEYACAFGDFSSVRALAGQCIARDGALIVHCHGRRPGLWGQMLRVLHPRRIRTIVSFHGIASFGPAKKVVVAAEESVLSLGTDLFIAAAPAEVAMFRWVPKAAEVTLIPYSYNPDAVIPWTGRPVRRIGFCARFEEPKLQDLLIKTVAAYNRTAATPVELVLAGDGSRRGAVDCLGQSELGARYTSLGQIPRVVDFYARIDAFAHFSRYEGLPLSLIDAMACGMPCIATDVIGCRDAIENGKSGILVPLGDIEAGARAIADLVEQPLLAATLAANAAARARSEYCPDRFWERHSEIYRAFARQLHGELD